MVHAPNEWWLLALYENKIWKLTDKNDNVFLWMRQVMASKKTKKRKIVNSLYAVRTVCRFNSNFTLRLIDLTGILRLIACNSTYKINVLYASQSSFGFVSVTIYIPYKFFVMFCSFCTDLIGMRIFEKLKLSHFNLIKFTTDFFIFDSFKKKFKNKSIDKKGLN